MSGIIFFLPHYGIYDYRSFNSFNSDFISYRFHFFMIAIDIINAIPIIFY